MLDRQLGIIYLLMKKNTVTAAELAERYEVSVRTIYRDIETLSMAGIPVYTRKGKNGGISLTEQFVLDKLLVTEQEQQQILAALQSLEEVGAGPEQDTRRKLGDFFRAEPKKWVAIDFSDWSDRGQQLFEDVRRAILENRVITFDYYGQYGAMSRRTVEPVQLLFKEYTWYLRAFCRDRQAMRLFKLLRMKRVTVLEEMFLLERDGQQEENGMIKDEGDGQCGSCVMYGRTEILIHIAASEAYRVYDRFEEEEITVLPEHDFLIRMNCLLDDWVYGMLLSFGPSAEVLAPAEVREELKRRLQQTLEQY